MNGRANDRWLPIGTAPTNGARLMLWHRGRSEAVFGRWHGEDDSDITHWQWPPRGPEDIDA